MLFLIPPQSVRTVAPPLSCCSIARTSPVCQASSLVRMAKAMCVSLSQLRLRRSKPVWNRCVAICKACRYLRKTARRSGEMFIARTDVHFVPPALRSFVWTAAMNEFEFIRNLREQTRSRHHSARVINGIGDDASVLTQRASRDLIVTTDLIVEGV